MTKGRLPRTLSSALRAGWGPLSTVRPGKGLSPPPAAPGSSSELAHARADSQCHLAHGAGDTGQCSGHNPQPRSQHGRTTPAPAPHLQQQPARCVINQTLAHPPNAPRAQTAAPPGQHEPQPYSWEAMASVSPYRLCRL